MGPWQISGHMRNHNNNNESSQHSIESSSMSTSAALESLLPVRWMAIAAVATQSSLVRWLCVCEHFRAHIHSAGTYGFITFATICFCSSYKKSIVYWYTSTSIVIRSGMGRGGACMCACVHVFISSTATYAARHCLVGNHGNCSQLAISYQNNAHFLSNAECCHNINRDGNAKHSSLRIRLTQIWAAACS